MNELPEGYRARGRGCNEHEEGRQSQRPERGRDRSGQPAQELVSGVAKALRISGGIRPGSRRLRVRKPGKLRLGSPDLGGQPTALLQSPLDDPNSLRFDVRSLFGFAAELFNGPFASAFRRRFRRSLAPEVAFEFTEPIEAQAHLRDRSLVRPAAGETGLIEGALRAPELSVRTGKASGRLAPRLAQILEPLDFVAHEPMHVRRERVAPPFETDPFPALLEKPPRLVHERRFAAGILRFAPSPFDCREAVLLTAQFLLAPLNLSQRGFGAFELARLRAPDLGRHDESTFPASRLEVIAAGQLAQDVPGNFGVGIGLDREQVLDMQRVAVEEAVFREGWGLDPLPVPGPGHGRARAGGFDDLLLASDGEDGLDVDAFPGELGAVEHGPHRTRDARLAGSVRSVDDVDPTPQAIDLESGAGDSGQTANREAAELHVGSRRSASSSSRTPSAARSSSSESSASGGGASPCAAKLRRPLRASRRCRAPSRIDRRSGSPAGRRSRRTLRAMRAGGSAPRASSSRSRAGRAAIRQSCTKYTIPSRAWTTRSGSPAARERSTSLRCAVRPVNRSRHPTARGRKRPADIRSWSASRAATARPCTLLTRLESVERDIDLLPAKRRERQVFQGEFRAVALEQPWAARAGLPGTQAGERSEIADGARGDQGIRLVDMAEEPGIDRSALELGGANRGIGTSGRIPVAVQKADHRAGTRIERRKLVRGKRARQYPALGEGPAEDADLPSIASGHLFDLPLTAAPEEAKAGYRIREARENLHVVVAAHREHRDPGRREAIDPAAEIAVGLVEVVLLLDDISREQHRVGLGLESEADGARPRCGRPEIAGPNLVQNPLRQARWLPAEMDVTDAKKLHCLS